jgi:hypothetical protein
VDSESFWNAIEFLHGKLSESGLDALESWLAAQPDDDIVEFSDLLSFALFQLDTHAHFTAAAAWTDPEHPGLGLSGDAFLAVRCAVVASGRKVYESVLRSPPQIRRPWQAEDAETLLAIPEVAFERSTGRDWTHWSRYEVETGSNRSAWPPVPDRPGKRPPDPELDWLSLGVVEHKNPPSSHWIDVQSLSDATFRAQSGLLKNHAASELTSLGYDHLMLILEFGAGRKKTRVRRNKKEVIASIYADITDIAPPAPTESDWLGPWLEDAMREILAKLQ